MVSCDFVKMLTSPVHKHCTLLGFLFVSCILLLPQYYVSWEQLTTLFHGHELLYENPSHTPIHKARVQITDVRHLD